MDNSPELVCSSAIINQDYTNVLDYFSNSYPRRSFWANLLFRRGEGQRISTLKRWLSGCQFTSLLDVGCGDGYFLSQSLPGKIELMRLEDINPGNIRLASARLNKMAGKLEVAATDSFLCHDTRQYDVVLAIGLLDYYSDWPHILETLLKRTKQVMIFDCPRANTLHSVLRKVWLLLHNISLSTIAEREINNNFILNDCPYEIEKLASSWMIKIDHRGCNSGGRYGQVDML